MTRRLILSCIAAVLAIMVPQTCLADEAWALTSDGLGPVRVGMTAEKVSYVLGQPLHFDGDEQEIRMCIVTDMPGFPGVRMLFLRQHLDSIIVRAPSRLRTLRGIGIGASEDEVKAHYAPLDIKPRDYQDLPAKDMTFQVSTRGIRFKTDAGGQVDEIVAGGQSITWMEGCA